jgi:hypothetical protein
MKNTYDRYSSPECKAYGIARKAFVEFAKTLVGKVYGKAKVIVPQKFHDASYECAAWWQDRVSATGVFPVILSADFYNDLSYFFTIKLPATIEKENFQSLFCGNAIGGPYDMTKNAGKPCQEITVRKEISATINETSSFIDKGCEVKWAILPEFWETFATLYRLKLAMEIALIAWKVTNYAAEPTSEFNDTVTGLKFAGRDLSETAEFIENIERDIAFCAKSGTDYVAKNNDFLP